MKRSITHGLAISLFIILVVCLVSYLSGCQPVIRKEAKTPKEALKEVRYFLPQFTDDMDLASLRLAIQRNLRYLKALPPNHVFFYGPKRVSCRRVIETQQAIIRLLTRDPSPKALNKAIKEGFLVFRARGLPPNGKVLFTGYYLPTYEASLVKNSVFKYPIYAKPGDLVTVDLSMFDKKLTGKRLMGRVKGQMLVPYYSRNDIELRRALAGRNLEIAWLKDPVDALFLQIQGSGRLLFPDGNRICVGYAASNGHPYKSIGRYLIERGYVERNDISMQKIREFLHNHPFLVQKILGRNPSYVFFRILENGPLGNIGVPLTAGRSIALDSHLFPKGALAFIRCRKPVIGSRGDIKQWVPFSRFVLNQDTGGAIKGAGRADIFWGSGAYAELAAGHMKHQGELYILIKKKKNHAP